MTETVSKSLHRSFNQDVDLKLGWSQASHSCPEGLTWITVTGSNRSVGQKKVTSEAANPLDTGYMRIYASDKEITDCRGGA